MRRLARVCCLNTSDEQFAGQNVPENLRFFRNLRMISRVGRLFFVKSDHMLNVGAIADHDVIFPATKGRNINLTGEF